MSPYLLSPNVDDAFDMFIGSTIRSTDDLYFLDGETAFRRSGRTIETCDAELALGGHS